MLNENIKEVLQRVNAASGRAGREVKIVAATKTVSADRINEIKPFITAMGENRVQELLSKYDQLEMDEIHFIGALQTNKVKYIVDKVCMIQSVDRLPLALEIDKRCKAIGKVMPVLIEVNIGQESTKSGLAADQAYSLIEEVKKLGNIRVDGLMSVLPIGAEDKLYIQMKELFDGADKRFGGIKYLSMGMSDDYEKAIELGANLVRIGSALFGKRDYIGEK